VAAAQAMLAGGCKKQALWARTGFGGNGSDDNGSQRNIRRRVAWQRRQTQSTNVGRIRAQVCSAAAATARGPRSRKYGGKRDREKKKRRNKNDKRAAKAHARRS
jgi:hypothetical protein